MFVTDEEHEELKANCATNVLQISFTSVIGTSLLFDIRCETVFALYFVLCKDYR